LGRLEMRRAFIKLHFEPRDLWLGIYWTTRLTIWRNSSASRGLHVYICIVPMLPIHIAVGLP
jgi:hypothetical protein